MNKIKKILVIGHSSAEERQKRLFLNKEFSKIKIFIIVPENWGGNKFVYEHKKNITIIPLKTFNSGKINWYILNGINSWVRKINPDIIYYQGEPWSFMALKCAIISKIKKIPLFVYTFENLQQVYNRRDKKFFYFNRLLEFFVLKNTKGIIAGNKDAKKLIKKRGFKGKIFILPISGISENLFNNLNKKDKTKMLFVGRVVKEKGIDEIFDALKDFKGKNKDFVLEIIGDGEDRIYFEKKSMNLGLRNNVHFIGQKEYSSIPKYMKGTKIFFYPSRRSPFWEEQFGFSIAEALSCGCEIITTKTGAIPEWFGNWVWLVDEKSPKQIISCLKKIFKGEKKNTYKGEYSLVAVAKKTREILCEKGGCF